MTTHVAPGRRPRARRSSSVLLLCAAVVLGLCAAASPRAGVGRAYFPLISSTVAVGADGRPVELGDQTQLVAGSRVVADLADSARHVAEQQHWLAAGHVPTVPGLGRSTMVRDALLDLHVLTAPYGVTVAAWTAQWRYVWPRDSALAASALARTGHLDDAESILGFLQRVQPPSGIFAARYRPDGSGVPDERDPQLDGVGWSLWALRETADQLPAAQRAALVTRYRHLLDTSSGAALAIVDNPRSLPGPSPDYWEKAERTGTLSTAALTRAGLAAAADLYALVDEPERAADLQRAADRTAAAITRTYAGHGFPRTPRGGAGSVDLGVSYLLPPFVSGGGSAAEESASRQRVVEAWRGSAARMSRAAGGLSPGGSWRDDGVSWNTATSSFALSAAFLDPTVALARLRWLDDHRTPAGSLPEKVLAGGEPASVAPLAWPAAAVVIAADELAEHGR